MGYYTQKRIWKLFLLVGAITIGVFTLTHTYNLTSELKVEERKKVEIWYEAMKQLSVIDYNDPSISLIFKVISQNSTIPVILTDESDGIIHYNNIEITERDSLQQLNAVLAEMKDENEPIEVDFGDDQKQYLYYQDSLLIKKLSWFPVIQLLVVALFIFIAYLAFSSARKAEQDQVWVGMSKETAHQLGTPTSSLLGWVDVLKLREDNHDIAEELERDVERLQVVTDRFSKIGSKPELKAQSIIPIIEDIITYLDSRTARDVQFEFLGRDEALPDVKVNKVLFQWVLENICKNGVDAMKGVGIISIKLSTSAASMNIDICDTGKGLARNQFKTVFKPGFTTKLRGWGLGLSLAKRITEGYHQGKIFVKESEIGKGTCFRIVLPIG
ncbi:ATP-binding protein [Carboxylicivirga sp. N1Y90]|uniref:ATP-binding protein n=1 Tax=Carboxylicivirga fragile TaxID=3417571 RepID=UPI003D358BAB|nr:HAMP domain-containing histidine kinase [Marinilabiliaceae bacterium N1Y90]